MTTRKPKQSSVLNETPEEAKSAIIESVTQMELPMENAAQANTSAPKQNVQQTEHFLSVNGQASSLNLLGDVAFMFTRASAGMSIDASITPDKNGFYAFTFKATR